MIISAIIILASAILWLAHIALTSLDEVQSYRQTGISKAGLLKARNEAFARHRSAVACGDTRLMHDTRLTLGRAQHALLKAEMGHPWRSYGRAK